MALAVYLLLCRRNLRSTIRVGVARRGAQLQAHASLTFDGEGVLGSQPAWDFVPLAELRGTAAKEARH